MMYCCLPLLLLLLWPHALLPYTPTAGCYAGTTSRCQTRFASLAESHRRQWDSLPVGI
jgi:hypothetical protein